MADLQTCEETTSKIRLEVENCISEVNASGGDSDACSSANGLTGAGLSDDASKAADTVPKACTTFANRLTSHHNGIYSIINQLKAVDGAVAACTSKSGHSWPMSDTTNSFDILSQRFKQFTPSEDPAVMFSDLLSRSGTDLFEAGDALVAVLHKYEQVSAGPKQDGLGDGPSGKTLEAEVKA